MILGIVIGCLLVGYVVFVAVATWPGETTKGDQIKAANRRLP